MDKPMTWRRKSRIPRTYSLERDGNALPLLDLEMHNVMGKWHISVGSRQIALMKGASGRITIDDTTMGRRMAVTKNRGILRPFPTIIEWHDGRCSHLMGPSMYIPARNPKVPLYFLVIVDDVGNPLIRTEWRAESSAHAVFGLNSEDTGTCELQGLSERDERFPVLAAFSWMVALASIRNDIFSL